MFRLNSSTIDFSYRGVSLRSGVDKIAGCWFCCDDLLDMLGIEETKRDSLMALTASSTRSVMVNFIQPEKTRIWAHEAGIALLIFHSDLESSEQNELVSRIFKEIVTPTRKRMTVVDGVLLA